MFPASVCVFCYSVAAAASVIPSEGAVVEAAHGTVHGLSLVEACSDGDVGTVRKLLGEGRSVHETIEDGESHLSLAPQDH